MLHCPRLVAWPALALATCTATAHAQLSLLSSVSFSSGSYHYSYSVENFTTDDFAVVTLEGLFLAPNAVQNLAAPPGFFASFDFNLGLLSFLEDLGGPGLGFAAGTTTGAFTFDSPYAPDTGDFSALSLDGDLVVGSVAVVPGSVPEPSAYAAAGAALLGFLIVRHRRATRRFLSAQA